MKILLSTLLIALVLITSYFILLPNSSQLHWFNDYDKALEIAKKEKKDIYMFIAADKCKFCKLFKEKTLSNQDVIDTLNNEYILLYLSRDRHFIPDGFEIYGAPRHYFLTPSGEVIFESFGLLEPDGFFLLLDEVELNKED